MQEKVISHAGKGQREGFAESCAPPVTRARGWVMGEDCKRKNQLEASRIIRQVGIRRVLTTTLGNVEYMMIYVTCLVDIVVVSYQQQIGC